MTERTSRLLKYLFSLVLTLGFLYAAFRGTDTGQLAAAISSADYLWLFVMFLLLMLSHCLRSLRWRYLLEPIKAGIGFRNLFSGVMVGYFINNILPRAGELVRPYTLGKLESISRSAALGTIVVERMMDTISFLFLLALIPVVYDGHLRETFPWLGDAGIFLTAAVVILFTLITILMARRDMANRVVRFISRVLPARAHERFHRIVHSFLDGFLFLKRPKNFAAIFLLSAEVCVETLAKCSVRLEVELYCGSLSGKDRVNCAVSLLVRTEMITQSNPTLDIIDPLVDEHILSDDGRHMNVE